MTYQYFDRNVVISNKERNLAGFAACTKISPSGRDDIKFMRTCTKATRFRMNDGCNNLNAISQTTRFCLLSSDYWLLAIGYCLLFSGSSGSSPARSLMAMIAAPITPASLPNWEGSTCRGAPATASARR